MKELFEEIRSFHDDEVNAALCAILHDPMLEAVMRFTFPGTPDEVWQKELAAVNSIYDFQSKFIYKTVLQVLKRSSAGLSSGGFEKLDKKTPYLFISNHRDIILDTSLLNTVLFENGLIMTASAIGDNLVKKPFLYTLSRLNRNFLVRRGLPPKELLQSSRTMSEYIYHLLHKEQRSVWIAQREGRTKDGNDATHPGVLKMIAMAARKEDLIAFFKKVRIVPISISYEYDPTDSLKLPELLANLNNEVYVKAENEDFNSILSGIIGQKKRIHVQAGDLLDAELDKLAAGANTNLQIKILAQIIDKQIIENYKLWAPNYIAYDLLHQTDRYADCYSEAEKTEFNERMALRVDTDNPHSVEHFLSMYANPVANKAAIS